MIKGFGFQVSGSRSTSEPETLTPNLFCIQLSGLVGKVSGIRVLVYRYPKILFILSREHGAGRTLDVALLTPAEPLARIGM